MAHAEISMLEALARGEQSAVDAYQQVLSKLGETKGGPELRRLHAEHQDAAERLRRYLRERGAEPGGTGAWGAFVRMVEGAAKALGTDAALKVLKEGEGHGISEYEAALRAESCRDDCRRLVEELLPRTREHVTVLDRLMAGLAERIPAAEAQRRVRSGALLVCAYDDEQKCRENQLDGAISLEQFKAQQESVPKERELIFYCA